MQCKSVKIFFRVFLAFVMISFLFPLPIHQSGFSSYAIKSVFAGEPESENPTSDKFQLVPCGTKDWNNDGRIKDTDEYTEECHFSDFIVLIKRLTDYMIILGAAITAMAFAYAGFLMMSGGGDEGKITEAKEIFKKVVIGFLFMLSAWLIVNAIESWLLNTSPKTGEEGFFSYLKKP